MDDSKLIEKCRVVYPAIREIDRRWMRNRVPGSELTLMFNGNFFIKGGAHVVDAFERVQKIIPGARLRLCCDENKDFATTNQALRERYLVRIRSNSGIKLGRVTRDEMLRSVLPSTDIYLLPTYADAFCFAVLEAMSFGIPVVATNYFAIPEMVEDGVTGVLVDTSTFDCAKMFPGCAVGHIPMEFHAYVCDCVFRGIVQLVGSSRTMQEMGEAAISRVREKFSFQVRNSVMSEIYESALSG